jgi:soluble lytic murein transglycosylase-like protein
MWRIRIAIYFKPNDPHRVVGGLPARNRYPAALPSSSGTELPLALSVSGLSPETIPGAWIDANISDESKFNPMARSINSPPIDSKGCALLLLQFLYLANKPPA